MSLSVLIMKQLPTSTHMPLLYMLLGIAWVVFSEALLYLLIEDEQFLFRAKTTLCVLYVLLTTVLLYLLIRHEQHKLNQKEQEKQLVFQTTVLAAHRILNNFLNSMQLFKMEAEESKDFQKEILELYDNVIHEATAELQALSEVKDLNTQQLHDLQNGSKH